jgi:oxaloacetate decarboxylase gamma subunit
MSDLLADALGLMIVGMGFVFVFLTILVCATSLMSKLVLKYAPEPAPIAKAAPAAPVNASHEDAQLLAVLSAAVAKYRSDHKK